MMTSGRSKNIYCDEPNAEACEQQMYWCTFRFIDYEAGKMGRNNK